MFVFDFMKGCRKGFLLFLLVSLVVAGVNCPVEARKWNVMSYNLHHCGGMDKKVDEARIAGIISRYRPDVVAVQELDSVTSRCKNDQMRLLGEGTGMYYTFARTIDYGGGKYGIGILSKKKPLSVKRIPLPGKEPRMLLVCEFEDFYFANMHLALQEKNQLKSLPAILEQASSAKKPFLIAGDWNAIPSSSFIQEMSKAFTILTDTTVCTFPSYAPRECIDYIALYESAEAKVVSRKVGNEPVASDHNPVQVLVRLKK